MSDTKLNGGPAPGATFRALADLTRSLPVPVAVSFDRDHLDLQFASVADAVAWSSHLDLSQQCLRMPMASGDLYTAFAGSWRGWDVGADVLEEVDDGHGSAGTDVAAIRIRERCRCGWSTGWHESAEQAEAGLAGHVRRVRMATAAAAIAGVPERDLAALSPAPAEAAQLTAVMQSASRLGQGGVA